MKKDKNNIMEIGGMCIIVGMLANRFGGENIKWLAWSLNGLGSYTVAHSLIKWKNPYEKLFKALRLESDGQIPKYLGRWETDYGYKLKFSLPVGLSTDDFEKYKLAIEQYLNKKIKVGYGNYRVYIKVFENKIEKMIPYEFTKCNQKLSFIIGKEFGGSDVVVNMKDSVHLLIAGETGSGKSTLLRSLITNIVLSNRKISLYLIDLKNGVEFGLFSKCKAVKGFSKNRGEAEELLEKMLAETNKRYDLFFKKEVVNIDEYNKLKNKRKLDYKFIIIDEFADLQGEKGSISIIEELVAKARACGIHLIISTQRPDAKVLNGRIKANVPTVIGLKTMNSLNSRIIIDQDGLEKLRGKGHGLFKHGEVKEFQAMYLTVKEAKELIKHTYIEKGSSQRNKEESKQIGVLDNLSFIDDLRGDRVAHKQR